ncbi:MAG TPA: hypothetical protein VNT42_09795 [Sphingomonas sp.]|nr:hypothetical protein [Sphingomonas sp.]
MLSESLRSLPYVIHTNRELGLMLMGTKPLAMFRYIDGYEVDCVLRYLRMFDRHVAAGRFTKQVKVSPLQLLNGRLDHQIFYTLPNEDWRVQAMLELLALPGAWSGERERRFGMLLGYEDWQNDVWLDRHPGL